ncbi:Rpn family recombination-promoting nuclease/putative transposase [Pedobacter sp. PACM 27299]|uniref:Rpn family recombination-promoting nuclease/putative transposase n=1 Tax=Pedobacter sp. PACM 27299 TaxID=1727164 RepID=UPI000B0C0F4A|nr:Rpn family recombination-promoting nuclease/putative transposase [Pedobacter sp. PACM 27299]
MALQNTLEITRFLKRFFFDIACTTDDGEHFIIEMQQEKPKYFRDRCVFYLSRSINEQIVNGKRWQEPLGSVYIISLLDFKLADSEPESYLQDIALMNKQTGKLFYIKLGFKSIELPCFNKKEEELDTDLDKWLYIIKNMGKLTQLPVSFQEGVFFRVFQQAELNKMSKAEREIYNSNWKAYNDYENTIEYAAFTGAIKKSISIAKNMIQEHIPIDIICKTTGLPIAELENL